MKSESQDRRVIKTKNNLKKAFLSLIQKQNITEINIGEITQLAEVNRSTFYSHYLDIYDLVNEIEDDILMELHKIIVIENKDNFKAKDNTFSWLFNLITFLEENIDILKSLFKNNTNSNFSTKLTEYIITWLNEVNINGPFSEFQSVQNYLLSYIAHGMVGAIQTWLNDDQRLDATNLTKILLEITMKQSMLERKRIK